MSCSLELQHNDDLPIACNSLLSEGGPPMCPSTLSDSDEYVEWMEQEAHSPGMETKKVDSPERLQRGTYL